ncbi:MAG: CcmD family protein [Flavobacteriales bacterium]|jgi:CcmD family protein|nr:CcmD family protein [Flavobacteriales bacterium]MBT3962538.1 CcmD family protein [Flavobacteriales bacterium]MBT4705687.1 CcmD family protein [Flavobacteriales bacterium]MBT4930963.1 CcmD family protein [Flavobacteriales bacterium]MBT5132698.1 CcmD family protein [Flavobacteriales bacterium]
MKRLLLFLMVLISATPLFAQDYAEMADVMRDNGKIYVVVGVIVLIFAVLFGYLVFLGRKLNKLEESTQK